MSVAELSTAEQITDARLRMSYEQYQLWEHEGGLTEWIDGEVHIYIPPTDAHQKIVEYLIELLGPFVRLFNLGMVRVAPFTMRVLAGGNAREPDLFFLAAANLGRLTNAELSGPADLAIEVISPDSVLRNRDDKFYEYQAGGVREYWIIDPRPNRKRADFYVLGAQGVYQPVAAADGIYHSTVLPDLWLKLDWLWVESPNPLAALAEVVGTERLIQAIQSEAR